MKRPDPDSVLRHSLEQDAVWRLGHDLWICASPQSTVAAAMQALFPSLRVATDPTDNVSAEMLSLSLSDPDPDGMRFLCAFDTPLHRITDDAEIVPAVESLVTHLFARTQRQMQVVHMGMVVWGGRGILLPGDRGSGKSTLSLWLALQGATYYGDDLIGYDPQQDALYGLPKAVTLKQGSFDLFDPVPTHQDPLRGPVRYILPDISETGPFPLDDIDCIVFPEYKPYPGTPQRLQPGWTALALVQQLLGGVEWNDEAMHLVARLTDFPAYSLPFRSLDEATAWIRNTVGGEK